MRRIMPFAAVALWAFAACGCSDGPTLYRVVGEVSWKGVPIEDGQINFISEDGSLPPATAKIVNGRYEAWVAAGRMKVEIHGQRDMGFDKTMNQRTKVHYVDREYNFETILRFDVQKNDDNRADFHLFPKK
ncbi:MAG: hypothetical protein NZM29_02545 [Nitrospira sp.]|nr:hypothetical protein [Nitrospira sp.]